MDRTKTCTYCGKSAHDGEKIKHSFDCKCDEPQPDQSGLLTDEEIEAIVNEVWRMSSCVEGDENKEVAKAQLSKDNAHIEALIEEKRADKEVALLELLGSYRKVKEESAARLELIRRLTTKLDSFVVEIRGISNASPSNMMIGITKILATLKATYKGEE